MGREHGRGKHRCSLHCWDGEPQPAGNVAVLVLVVETGHTQRNAQPGRVQLSRHFKTKGARAPLGQRISSLHPTPSGGKGAADPATSRLSGYRRHRPHR